MMTKTQLVVLLVGIAPFLQNCSKARYQQVNGGRPTITSTQIPPAREPMGPLDVRPVATPVPGASTRNPVRPSLPPNASGEQPTPPEVIVTVTEPQPPPAPPEASGPDWKDPTYYNPAPTPVPVVVVPPAPQPPPYVPPAPEPMVCQPGSECFVGDYQQPAKMVTNKLDLLFVVDTSDSIFKEREAAANAIERLMSRLPRATDYHIGVLVAHGLKTGLSGELVRTGQEPAVLKSKEMSVAQIREALHRKLTGIKGDAETDGGELGLYSLDRAMTGAQLEKNVSLGMFRRDAGLAVIFMSDENDICSLDHYPAGVTPKRDPNGKEMPAFKKYCEGNVGAGSVYRKIIRLKVDGYDEVADMHTISKPVIVAAIVYTDSKTVPNHDSSDRYADENEVGYGYLDMVQMNNGIAVDLASGDIPGALATIGQAARGKLSFKSEFLIHDERPVDPQSITVSIDGISVPFRYDEARKEVQLLGEIGRPGSKIEIHYCVEKRAPKCESRP